ncbi:MAG: hypothetical protein MZV64_20015 [Ignavibacteriales bacterium]|nr:hypothetical protein [Ignavibacteriales bacterium]
MALATVTTNWSSTHSACQIGGAYGDRHRTDIGVRGRAAEGSRRQHRTSATTGSAGWRCRSACRRHRRR